MFTTGHFIWLGAICVIIAIAFISLKKFKIPEHTVDKAVMILLIILKIFHMSLSMKESQFGGYILKQTQLSFHLCSIMIYTIIFTNIIKNQKIIDVLKGFMVPCLFIGAAMALLIPTEGTDPTTLRV